MRIGLALRLFWAVLWDRQLAGRLQEVLRDERQAEAIALETARKPQPPAEARPTRNEALTLLAALQREARFVDLVQEPLHQYSDAQVGAAARDVLERCRTVLDRFFGIQPLAAEEGTTIEVPTGYDPYQYRLVGSVTGSGPYRGKVTHPGWRATRCQLPEWSGSATAAWIIAPTEVQVES